MHNGFLKSSIMQKHIILSVVIICSLFIGCHKNNDPLYQIISTSCDSYKLIQSLKNLDNTADYSHQTSCDSFPTIMSYTYPKNDSLKYRLSLNSDGMIFGQIRKVSIEIPNEGFPFANDNNQITQKRDFLLNQYMKWYGKPDTLIKNIKADNFSIIFPSEEQQKAKVLGWKAGNYNIHYIKPEISKTRKTMITYEIEGFDLKTNSLKKQIKQNLSTYKMIQPLEMYGTWNSSGINKEFTFEFLYLWRIDCLDDRSIKTIRFDLNLFDEFNELLHQEKKITLDLPFPLERQNEIYHSNGNNGSWTISYDPRSKKNRSIENARIYSEQHKVKVTASNVQLVLDDNSVIN